MKIEPLTGPTELLRTVQSMLLSIKDRTTITPTLIEQKIQAVLAIQPDWAEGLDRDAVLDELVRRFSIWIGKDTMLSDDTGHKPWLTADRRRGRRYWNRYLDWLDSKLPRPAVDAIDLSSEAILEQIEDPLREDSWDRRGLVVGHVQSGKTGNYTGLICKAADAGYKIIIVLAGVHNNLRSQTQVRLDEGFLGFETQAGEDGHKTVGAGLFDPDPSIAPDFATNRSENGDFNPSNTRNLGITPDRRPCLFVVKKNKTPLTRLLKWLSTRVADGTAADNGRKIIKNLPLLLIDDESDHASVDTGDLELGPDGNPDPEHDPKTINKLIRKILHTFTRKAYIGYTATPFANIFIHEKGSTHDEGPDLFPAAFIYNLSASSDYIGPVKVFGQKGIDGRQGRIGVVRTVEDYASEDGKSGWMPVKHLNGHIPLHEGQPELPPSLVTAIDSFILACAARRVRGQGTEHASMLVHVTRFNSVQNQVHAQVSDHLRRMAQRIIRGIDDESLLARLQTLWETDFRPTTTTMAKDFPSLCSKTPEDWEIILAAIPDALDEIKVKMINGTAKDALDYEESKAIGLKVIAIGGDKLSRGLTLEGLCVSYFLRTSKMYDTLMQMGRWFGYRPGYADLCRLFTTKILVEWFGHITDAAEELREEFDIMANSGENPLTFGHKVASHSTLLVTSRLKMRAAKDLWLSFSGDVLETVVFRSQPAELRKNLETLSGLVSALGAPAAKNPELERPGNSHRWEGYLWEGVEASHVKDFLSSYLTHPDAYKVNARLLAEFIQTMNEDRQLTHWTVALIGGGEGGRQVIGGLTLEGMLRRNDQKKPGKYSIGRLLSPRDEAIDLTKDEWQEALDESIRAYHADPGRMQGEPARKVPEIPSGPAIRKVRGRYHQDRGLLLLYCLDPGQAESEVVDKHGPPVVAFGISFPSSEKGTKVKYTVNNVLWRQWAQELDLAE